MNRQLNKLKKALPAVLDWAEVFIGSAFTVLLVFTFVLHRLRVEGGSMEDTLYNNDQLAVFGILYEPEQGDIVVCDSKSLDKLIVKRVIAVGGQSVTVDYIAGTVSVDGVMLDEPYLKYHAMNDMGVYDMTCYDPEKEVYEYNVPDGYVFLMGDNRDHSKDSRVFGAVSEDEIVGKAVFRFYSERARIGTIR